jgi:hypothetical protein
MAHCIPTIPECLALVAQMVSQLINTVISIELQQYSGDTRLHNLLGATDGVEKSDFLITGLSNNQDYLHAKAIAFTGLNYSVPAEPAQAVNALSQTKCCPNGLPAKILFPCCWNRVDSNS